jgi:hypothetical protein
MRISKTLILITAGLIVIIGTSTIVGLTVGVNRLWPTVRVWAQGALFDRQTFTTADLEQLSGRAGAERLRQLIQLGVDPATLLEPGKLLDAVAEVPELGRLPRNGAYHEAAREAICHLSEG